MNTTKLFLKMVIFCRFVKIMGDFSPKVGIENTYFKIY